MSDEVVDDALRGGRGREYGIAPPGGSLPASARLGPVRLQVADLERSREFYERVLGLLPVKIERSAAPGDETEDPGARRGDGTASRRSLPQAESGLVLGAAGETRPLVELVERPGASAMPRRGRLGLYHYALRVPDRPALGRVLLHLGTQDVSVGMADHRVSEALYLRDPDGLGIEIYRDRPRDRWESDGRQLVITTEPLDEEELLSEVDAPGGGRLPVGTRMGHVHLHVGDLERAGRFYHEGLGFEKVAWSYPGALFLGAGGYHHHVGLNTWARGARPCGPDDARLLSWTLVLPDEDAVERVVSRTASAGFRVGQSGDGFPAVGTLLEDPWGTAVRLLVETSPSP